MYVRHQHDAAMVDSKEPTAIAHAARVAAELGADIVKVSYTGSVESFTTVVEGCPVPVVVAGGAKGDTQTILASISECIQAGAAGISCGRNIFQHEDIVGILKSMQRIVHGPAQ